MFRLYEKPYSVSTVTNKQLNVAKNRIFGISVSLKVRNLLNLRNFPSVILQRKIQQVHAQPKLLESVAGDLCPLKSEESYQVIDI